MLDIQNIGLVELNAQEVVTIEGGNIVDHLISFIKGVIEGLL